MQSEEIGDVVLNAKQIEQGVEIVAEKLNRVFKQAVVITVIPGGTLFTADLVRKLSFPLEMDFISCPHTPGDRHNASSITFDNNIELTDKHVIMIDDAIESGGTMKRLVQFIKDNHPIASLSIATLFVKPGRVEIDAPYYFAYEMDSDDLLIGYGLPWKGRFRNLPYVCKLNDVQD
ncbi:hypoxanthine phosphoribosyltransferase [Vibrio sp. RE86]|uniref:phosphoribosyltransferase n=1 Tax=Vibrio sp. RE86 TaxID=2607605 RepID=UPI0014939C80|nr:phosphoribosyltransferase family protein [Vibrio sp. RE86]NOH81265.1 hypoxanthine phosphoribosyltransferase [Vibrio sp. RE86]